ncbi:hypothetical protein B9Z55_017614 [Caenorhabditis nigoni]|uniref:Uncharacterized protein n=1 Tax=Caenorhabditis nigoni TaxID=1611254 RepID=A0A2G5TA91_9PELO|nr:hypothetical protein B9Z55_017614 [Caenorhabditis nigoni]
MNFTSYLDTPQFQALALHLMIGLEIPIHMFGVFCILFRTPGSMRSVKWGMLNLHVWSMGLDLGVSLLTIPYILYPALAGFTLGVLTDFDVPMAYQAYLLAVLIGREFEKRVSQEIELVNTSLKVPRRYRLSYGSCAADQGKRYTVTSKCGQLWHGLPNFL